MTWTLAYSDRYLRVQESQITSDTSNSVAFASLTDTPNRLVVEWTSQQFLKLLSCVLIGADLLWSSEADEIIWQLVKAVHQPITLDESQDGCINFLPNAPFLNYTPTNPYFNPDVVPDGYLAPPFHLNSDFAYPELFGFKSTDVMVQLDALTIPDSWDDLVTLPFPTIMLHVIGQGQIELDLLSVAGGGYCIVKVGAPPNIIDIIDGVIETGVKIIDLNTDETGIPLESDLVVEDEVPIDALGGVDVYLTFIPHIDFDIAFFGFGGGIRQIGLCGLETDTSMTDYVTKIGYFSGEENPHDRLKYFSGGEWHSAEGDWETIPIELVSIGDSISALTAQDSALLAELNDQDDRISILEAAGSWDEARIAAIEADNLLQWDTLNEHADWLDNIQGDVWNLYERVDRSDEEITGVGNFDWGNTRIDQLEVLAATAAQEWSHTFDFLTDEAGWSSSVNSYSSGNGWIVDNGVTFDIHHGSTIILDNAISYIKLELKQKSGSGTRKKTWFNASGDNEQYIQMPSAADGIIEQWVQINYRDTSANTVHFLIDSNVASAEWYIRSMTIYGRGSDVF